MGFADYKIGYFSKEISDHWKNKMVQNFSLNTHGRDFIIGDLHGEYDQFIEILEITQFDKTRDRMFSVGDLVDRGPKSYECLKLSEEPWFFPCRGNHEDMMSDTIREHLDERPFSHSYSLWVLEHTDDEKRHMLQIVDTMPYVLNVETPSGKVGICHAQPPTQDWNDTNDYFYKNMIVWGRERIRNYHHEVTENIMATYHGHTPKSNVYTSANSTWLDTGACFRNGHLTAIDLTNMKTYNNAKDVYSEE